MRRFSAGDQFELGGLRFRVRAGQKEPRGPGEDLVLDWLTPEHGWKAVPGSAGALIADFICENEGVLYPSPPFEGADKYRKYLTHAIRHGWMKAEAGLRLERSYKNQAMF